MNHDRRKMAGKTIVIDRWHYPEKPDTTADENGDVVVIRQTSFAPAEVFEYGIGPDNRAFARYQWRENDFYEENNEQNEISHDELCNRIDELIELFRNHGFDESASAYERMKTQIVTLK